MNRLSNLYYNAFLELLNFGFSFYIIMFGIHINVSLTSNDKTVAVVSLTFQCIYLTDAILNLIVLGRNNLKNCRSSIKLEIFLQIIGIVILIWES